MRWASARRARTNSVNDPGHRRLGSQRTAAHGGACALSRKQRAWKSLKQRVPLEGPADHGIDVRIETFNTNVLRFSVQFESPVLRPHPQTNEQSVV